MQKAENWEVRESIFGAVHSLFHILVQMSNKHGSRTEEVRNDKSFEVSKGTETEWRLYS